MERQKKKYPYLEYHFVGDPATLLDPLVGSAIRAIGKGWSVGVVSQGEALRFWQEFSREWQAGAVFVSPNVDDLPDTKMLFLDASLPPQQQRFIANQESVLGKRHVLSAGAPDQGHSLDWANLISQFDVAYHEPTGAVAFVGSGKGKTTSALGWAWRQAQGKPVVVIQWFKEKATGRLTWSLNEHFAPDRLQKPESLQFFASGLGFFGSPNLDRVAGEEAYQHHRRKAQEGLALASQFVRERSVGAIVLDEFVDTVASVSQNIPRDLLLISEVRALLHDAQKSGLPVAVSGRRVTADWSEFLRSSVEITNVRHPWTHEKRAAVSGLDF